MQVDCSKCAPPIALTDSIESTDGGLSHLDCERLKCSFPRSRRWSSPTAGSTSWPAARAVREAARRLVKQSRELCDEADVLIREAEAALFDSQRLLREALSRRAAS